MPCTCCGGHERRSLQRQTTVQQDQTFRIEMEHLFNQHGNQGVQINELGTELENTELMEVIPKKKLVKFLQKADKDKNNFITYNEFMGMYSASNDLTKSERSAMRKFVGAAVNNIVPRSMREDFLQNYTCNPPPIFMVLISVTEIAMFVYYAVLLSNAGIAITAYTGIASSNPFMYMPQKRHEAWRFLAYMLLHQGYMHLIANLMFQLLLGLSLEIVHKWWRVMLVYFCGVVGGSLAHSVTDYDVNLVGASGGCYALIGAHIAAVIVNWKEMNYKCSECENPIRVVASAPFRLAILFLLVAVDTGNAIYRRYFEYDPNGGKVGITAHFGGLLTGLLLGVPVMKNINELPWERKVGWVALTLYLVAVAFCIVFNGVFPGYPETDFSPCC